MKKLLLFTLVLFGIISTQSFAWNYGCGENIPPDVCGAGSSQPIIGVARTGNYNAFAYDKESGAYGTGYKPKASDTKKEALEKCGTKNCKILVVKDENYNVMGYVVTSSNGLVLDGYIEVGSNSGNAVKKIIKKCEDKGGINCRLVWNTWYGWDTWHSWGQ